MAEDDSAFWRFSLRFYDAPEVQADCLTVQDRDGADVNVVLYLLHRASNGDCLSREGIATIDSEVAAWREEVVRPLRAIRRRLKPRPYPLDPERQESFRNEIKRVELRSEKMQQLFLETLAPPTDRRAGVAEAAKRNLRAYASLIGADGEAPEYRRLSARLMEIARPD
ncbi:TIGR02444 family protein [Lutibaculum baratangense]|uniref:TIGR02444 family protein n=1 Tax=Lutibaculum baratangense AMV1 TaxID=631454 RepID=V4TM69_9HYPH|nr:TIGR02444 family protein [Lutibaculum baratangense]ESR26858.1 hypothetical protein N177_0642 [Lutibaculum baratangense AMV1]